jgi:hypothetical protein
LRALKHRTFGRLMAAEAVFGWLLLAAGLSRWLQSRDLAVGDVTAEVIEEFFAGRRTDGCPRWRTSRWLGALLECLQVIRPEMAGGVPAGGMLARYRDYLLAECGLAASTAERYLRLAAGFLVRCPGTFVGLDGTLVRPEWVQTRFLQENRVWEWRWQNRSGPGG